jgi:hypothetical protein
MQTLIGHLNGITKTLETFTATELATIEDAKVLKNIIGLSDKITQVLNVKIGQIDQIKLRALGKLSNKVANLKPLLLKMEDEFKIKYTEPKSETKTFGVPRPISTQTLNVDIGYNIMIPAILFAQMDQIPLLGYGAIMYQKSPLVVFNYGYGNFVSLTASHVAEYGSGNFDNYRTICCANPGSCEYKNSCKFFHDPLLFPDSQHVNQRFIKSPLVKKAPNFGNGPSFQEHLQTMDFESLRSLARYSAYMVMLIGHLVHLKQVKTLNTN